MIPSAASIVSALLLMVVSESPLELPTELLVTNFIGESIVVYLDSMRLLELAPGGAARFGVRPGRHKVAAECPATGHTEIRDVSVGSGGLTELHFGPQGGRLLVANFTGDTLKFFRNGKPLSSVKPGVMVEFGAQPLGRSLIEAVSSSGTVVYRKSVDITPLSEGRAEIAVVSIYVTAVVSNESGEPVKLGPGVVSERRVIQPGEELSVDVEGIQPVLKLRGEITGTRYDRLLDGSPGESVRIVLKGKGESLPASLMVGAVRIGGRPEPQVEIRNWTKSALSIRLDSVLLGEIAPGESKVISIGSPGVHTLSAQTPNAAREWLLKSVYFDEKRKFGWTLTE